MTVVLAHGLGGSSDLPVPYAYAMVGAAWALTFTFALVAFAWRRPRFDPLKPGRPLPAAVTTLVDAGTAGSNDFADFKSNALTGQSMVVSRGWFMQ